MCGEDGCDIDGSFSAQGDSDTGLPFMEMGYHGGCQLAGNVLAQEPSYDIAEDNCLVRFVVARGAWNSGEIPKIALPFVELIILTAGVEEQNVGSAFNEPSAIEGFDTTGSHLFESRLQMGIRGLLLVDLHGGSFVGKRADEAISVAIL